MTPGGMITIIELCAALTAAQPERWESAAGCGGSWEPRPEWAIQGSKASPTGADFFRGVRQCVASLRTQGNGCSY